MTVVQRCRSSEHGAALVAALISMTMMMALGTALALTAAVESKVARNFRVSSEATYAADAILERALDDIVAVRDWNTLLNGAVRSAFVDGAPQGIRTLADGSAIDLGQVVNMANCQKPTLCSDDMNRVTDARPWGLDNPRWTPFAWGAVNNLTRAGSVNSPLYVVLLAGDDPSECDNDPLVDGGAPIAPCGGDSAFNPGTGVLSLRAEAFGPFGTHQIIEATIARAQGNAGVRMLSWREAR